MIYAPSLALLVLGGLAMLYGHEAVGIPVLAFAALFGLMGLGAGET